MSSELSILALFGLVIVATILLQVVFALGQTSLMELARSRDNFPELTGIAGRFVRTVNNSIIAMTLFAPAVLILGIKDAYSAQSLLACQIFLLARIAYVPIYAAGIPWARTAVWLLGFFATIYLYVLGF